MKRLGLLLVVLVVGSGCSLFGSDERAEVQIAIPRTGLLDQAPLTLRLNEDGRTWEIHGSDFGPQAQTVTGYATPSYETGTDGTLDISFRLGRQEDPPIATGTLAVDLREDWRWSVFLLADSATADPTKGCMGCIRYHSFEIDQSMLDDTTAGTDSVYAVLSGNGISDPVVY